MCTAGSQRPITSHVRERSSLTDSYLHVTRVCAAEMLLTRGYIVESELTSTAIMLQTAGLGCVILLDMITLALATILFMSPLEQMVRLCSHVLQIQS